MPTGPAGGDRTEVPDPGARRLNTGQAGIRRPNRPPESGGRFGLLLTVLIGAYLISAFNGQTAEAALQVVLFAAALLIALRSSPLPRPWPGLMGAALVAGSGAALGAALTGTKTGLGLADVWKAVILLLAAVLIVRRVLARPEITIQSIYGALSAYLIVGLMFAASYAAIEHLTTTPFFADDQPATTQTFQYFSFTTLTTLGYGDFTAAGNGGRAIAVMEAIVGQVFLATLVARLVAGFRRPAQSAVRRRTSTALRRRRPGGTRRP